MQPQLLFRFMPAFRIAIPALLWLHTHGAFAQPATRTSFEETTGHRPRQQVSFRRRSARLGDQVDQRLSVEMDLQSMVRQAQQTVGQSRSAMKQTHERVITASQVHDNLMTAARVRYVTSAKVTTVDGKQNESRPDPVAGKTYRCRRDGEKLTITDENGQIPPFSQYAIVARSMDGLGRPNPLATFLAGKTLVVGQRIALPNELGEQLLGLGEAVDRVEKFDLTLDGTTIVADAPCAVFHVLMEATQHYEGQMRMQLEGSIAVETEGCRLVRADLLGPLGFAKSVGAAGSAYHMTATGKLRVAINAKYSNAR